MVKSCPMLLTMGHFPYSKPLCKGLRVGGSFLVMLLIDRSAPAGATRLLK
jgi:hypothetical protein